MKFWDFPDASYYRKILSLKSYPANCEAFGMYQFIINYHVSFHLWWKENVLTHQNVWKYCEHDC